MRGVFDLSGKTALVTGSTRGLGLAMARALADAGARVAINGRTADGCEAVLWDGAVAAPFDVTDEDAVADGVARLGRIDVLVNNAGVQLRRRLEEVDLAEWRRMLDANLTSAFLVARAVAPQMIERGSGKIVNTCSVTSEVGRETIGPYTASKGGLRQLTRAMCADWGRHGIQANGIGPGYFRTEMNRDLQESPAFVEWLEQRVPAGRWGRVEELGGAVVFLASAASDYVNGQILYVDGGMLAVL
ncbi:SDR family oxidoreductase [Gaiella sp.]|jgi:gluconate 5-dehydrogenase|uniref:SDR family oxidoreductase n=1 Tax=Gaiella sp. TaxID=2663207 RepID=UPI002C2C53CD|nr:SDR family oxidoreductase [Gaiella sp.]HWO80566.1 SDR family oxidoreductase [Gaiella sp.]